MPGPSVVIEIACCLLKALHGTATYKDWREPLQQQEPGFQCETAAQQRCGPDAMAKGQNRKKLFKWDEGKSCRFRLATADFRR